MRTCRLAESLTSRQVIGTDKGQHGGCPLLACRAQKGFDKMDIYERIKSRHAWNEGTILDAALGLGRETGEVEQLVSKWLFDGQSLVPGDMLMELSDVAHYLVLACIYFGVTLDELLEINTIKMVALDSGQRRTFEAMMYHLDVDHFKDEIRKVRAEMEAVR